MLANSIKLLQKAMIIKLNTIKKCTEQLMKQNNSNESYDLSSEQSKSAEFEIEAIELDKIIEDLDKTPSHEQSDISMSESLNSDIDSENSVSSMEPAPKPTKKIEKSPSDSSDELPDIIQNQKKKMRSKTMVKKDSFITHQAPKNIIRENLKKQNSKIIDKNNLINFQTMHLEQQKEEGQHILKKIRLNLKQ